ncbi:hypothetical protein J6590_033818 [Homalodisca vitripennis]|nr:hypothetical protein J6590_033818 [Homalodisca vitripennis]
MPLTLKELLENTVCELQTSHPPATTHPAPRQWVDTVAINLIRGISKQTPDGRTVWHGAGQMPGAVYLSASLGVKSQSIRSAELLRSSSLAQKMDTLWLFYLDPESRIGRFLDGISSK